jgi:type III pantothenate kinase
MRNMILAIDIGNTNIVVGCIDKEKIYFTERISTIRTKTELEYAIDIKTILDIHHINRADIEGAILLFRRLHQQPDWLYRKFSKRMQ